MDSTTHTQYTDVHYGLNGSTLSIANAVGWTVYGEGGGGWRQQHLRAKWYNI